MIWIICLFASVAAFVFAVISAIVMLVTRYHAEKPKNPMNVLTIGAFVASLLLQFPICLTELQGSVFRGVLLTIHSAISMFIIDVDYLSSIAVVESCAPVWLHSFYFSYAAVLYVVAPVLTFGFILSLFKNLSAHIGYGLSYGKDAYIFSELNLRSLTLARDIKRTNPRAAIVFCDVFEQNEERSFELIEQSKELGAIRFQKDILAINFGFHSKKKDLRFFVIGQHEAENINQSLKIIQRYGEHVNAHLYVFSTRIESELLLSSPHGKNGIKVRRINEVRSVVNRFLYDHGKLLFDSAIEGEDGKKVITAVIVGTGNHGTEMTKALAWFCQMIGYRVEIHAFDKDPLAEEKFTALCPELMSPKYNGVYVDGEAQYKIVFHSGIDVQTATFAKEISALRGATFSFVSLGSDAANISAANTLRMLFERNGCKSEIFAALRNSTAKEKLQTATNYRGQPYGVHYVGDLKESYSVAVLIDSKLEAAALARHLKWGDEEDFWKYEYNYRSSMASAIHMHVRDQLNIPGANKAEEDLTEAEIAILEPLEHCRWNAYMRSEGYVYSGSPDKASRNDLAKMHHNLVVFEALSEEDQLKDRRVGSK